MARREMAFHREPYTIKAVLSMPIESFHGFGMYSRHGRSLFTVKKLSNLANITYSGIQWDSNSNSVTQRPGPILPPPVPTPQLSPLLLAHEMLNTQPEGKGLNILGQDHHQTK